MPSEVLLAFMVNSLGFMPDKLESFTILPRDNATTFSILISKYEARAWPLSILLSLQMDVRLKGDTFITNFTRLRRGSQDLSLGLAWAYFGSEIEKLKKLETLPETLTPIRETSLSHGNSLPGP